MRTLWLPVSLLLMGGSQACGPGEGPDPAGGEEWAGVAEVRTGSSPRLLLRDGFEGPDGLITNELAVWSPTAPDALRSEVWALTSGSLFRRSGTGWTGEPDDVAPDAQSSQGNDSAVFRMVSRRADFGDVAVSFKLLNHGLTATRRTPAQDWDGVHVWLRYMSEESLYALSVHGRDGSVVIKKKVPGGVSNGGTYFTLASAHVAAVPYGAWQTVRASIKDGADGSVTLELFVDGQKQVAVEDKGVGGPPIQGRGHVGIRGDNCAFQVDDFRVESR